MQQEHLCLLCNALLLTSLATALIGALVYLGVESSGALVLGSIGLGFIILFIVFILSQLLLNAAPTRQPTQQYVALAEGRPTFGRRD